MRRADLKRRVVHRLRHRRALLVWLGVGLALAAWWQVAEARPAPPAHEASAPIAFSGPAAPLAQATATSQRPAVRVTAGLGPGVNPQPLTTAAPGGQGLPPTIPPVQPVRPGAQGTAGLPAPAGEGATQAYPGQPGEQRPPLPTLGARPSIAPTAVGTATALAAPGAAAVTPGATGGAPLATSAAPAFLTLSGRIIEQTGASFVVSIPNRGSVTVTPGPDTEVRRDGAPSSVASLAVGDNVTLVLGEGNQLLRILVTTELPPEPEPESGIWTVFWQAMLGLVMMGAVLMIDTELREKFLGALLEPTGSYGRDRGPSDG